MNAALSAGETAMVSWVDYDTKMYPIETYVFADGHRVRPFQVNHDGFGGPDTYTTAMPPCAGPFRVATVSPCGNVFVLEWDGC